MEEAAAELAKQPLDRAYLVLFGAHRAYSNISALACHAGIAPFQYQSGGSVKGKSRGSHRSNKRLKSLLHMAVLSSVRVEGELKRYYERKVAEGKNKMSILNAVRNKIIHRVFAVPKKNTEYRLEMS